MSTPGDSAEEMPLSAVELKTDWPMGWPGGSVRVAVIAREWKTDVDSMVVSLETLEGRCVTQSVPHKGTAILEIPRDCQCGRYLLCVSLRVSQDDQWLNSLPFEITSRRAAERMRQPYDVSILQTDAVTAQPTGNPRDVKRAVSAAERIYVGLRETRLVRKTWEETSEALPNRGLRQSAQEAMAHARALWRIARRLVNAENRQTKYENLQITRLINDAPGWLRGRPGTLQPLDTAERLAYQEQVRLSLVGLGPEERQAWVLARLGYSPKKIAVRMGISASALLEYLYRGYAKMKATLPTEEI